MSENVRVRFAPSPTGNMHIGGVRTALFNWLFARHHEGTFLVRIEDTDRERSEKKYVGSLLDALRWVGIESDEEIIFQSERYDVYRETVALLLAEKKAYRCYCTPQEVEARVRAQGITDEHYGYDGFCREKEEEQSRPYSIRFVLPQDIQAIEINDLIRGKVVFDRSQLDDFIIFRSDKTPMYNYAVVIDDHFSRITHIIRGEEHLSNTPKQLLLYKAFGFKVPQFAHIPMILAPDGTKLSKRYGAVDVLAYREEGFFADALINYIVRLGWAYGDQELFTRSEMIEHFTLDGVGKKAAIFDREKLLWMNGIYLRNATPDVLYEALQETSLADDFAVFVRTHSHEQIMKAIKLYQSRVATLVDLAEVIMKLFKEIVFYDHNDLTTFVTSETKSLLNKVRGIIQAIEPFEGDLIKKSLQELCVSKRIQFSVLAQPVRIALTGVTSSPGIFELILVLGKETTVKRLEAFERYLT